MCRGEGIGRGLGGGGVEVDEGAHRYHALTVHVGCREGLAARALIELRELYHADLRCAQGRRDGTQQCEEERRRRAHRGGGERLRLRNARAWQKNAECGIRSPVYNWIAGATHTNRSRYMLHNLSLSRTALRCCSLRAHKFSERGFGVRSITCESRLVCASVYVRSVYGVCACVWLQKTCLPDCLPKS